MSYYNILIKYKAAFYFDIYIKMQFIPVMAMLNFQQPLLQSSVSHDPSEIILISWFGAKESFIIIINVEKFI